MLLSLFNVMRKEFTQTLRDRRMVIQLLVAPVLQLFIFGYAINLDVDRIPTVVCNQDQTRESRDLIQRFFANGTFERKGEVPDPAGAQTALETGDAAVTLIMGRGFAVRSARHGDTAVQVLVDGTDTTRAQVAANAAAQFLQLNGVNAAPRRVPTLIPRILYNQRLSTSMYMLPGVLASLLLNITALMAAMGLVRERETGTLEQVLVTPIRPVAFLAGKCLPYILFGLIDVVSVMLLSSLIFAMPIRGPLVVLALGSFLYIFSTLGFGVLLATLSSTQQQTLLGAFAFILPAALLGGFMSPIDTMPRWVQLLTLLNPMRHFIEIMRMCLLKGAGMGDLVRQLVCLAALGIGLLAISVLRFRKRIT